MENERNAFLSIKEVTKDAISVTLLLSILRSLLTLFKVSAGNMLTLYGRGTLLSNRKGGKNRVGLSSQNCIFGCFYIDK
ncbi:hypothetical protein [Psychrobacillus lasiicapitis]|uniref:hypothetical protein n=1 Tax=Psychrobacillus lasiicapitis TaxID=1636719 RepID=UPI001B876C0D|nr:hypothetical protein [Psychrobacillus lasiicapitis]